MKAILKGFKWLVIVVAVAAIGLGTVGSLRLAKNYPLHQLASTDAEQASIEEGERLVALYQCAHCHGEDLAGSDFIDAGWLLLQLPAANLTQADQWTDLSLESAVRHGVGRDGQPLLIMPSDSMNQISDQELASMSAYLRSLTPIDRTLITRHVGPVGRVAMGVVGTGVMAARRIDHELAHPAAIDSTPMAIGQSRAQICMSCHGSDLAGLTLAHADDIQTGNLTPDEATGLGSWTQAEFRAALIDGRGRDGRTLSKVMPSQAFSQFTEAEIDGLWLYLQSLPPIRKENPAG